MNSLINWADVQKYYNQGHSLRDCSKFFNIPRSYLDKASKSKKIIARNTSLAMKCLCKQGRCSFQKIIWDDKARKKKSEEKKEYFKKHPEKHPNRLLANNKNKISYPEKLAYCFLEDNNISFIHQFQIGSYFVDFLVENCAIEIDGKYFHQNLEYEEERENYIISKGYKFVRFAAKNVIAQLNIYFNKSYKMTKKESLQRMVPVVKKEYFCEQCGNKVSTKKTKLCMKCWKASPRQFKENLKNQYSKVKNKPTKEELISMLASLSYTAVGKKYSISANAVMKWAKKHGFYQKVRKYTRKKSGQGDSNPQRAAPNRECAK